MAGIASRLVKLFIVLFMFVALWDSAGIFKIIATFILIYKALGVLVNG